MNPKQWPEVAEARKRTADAFRKLRKINPKMAKIIYKRMKLVREKLIKEYHVPTWPM